MVVAIKLIGIFLGVLARSLAPYLRKLREGSGLATTSVNVEITGDKSLFIIHIQTLDTTPPSLVMDFQASDDQQGQITLSWTNPSDSDLAEVVVKRKTGSYPSNHTDGTTVYQNLNPNPGEYITYSDTDVESGVTYYYAVFSRDSAGNWNDQVQEGNVDTGTALPISQPGISLSAQYYNFGDVLVEDYSDWNLIISNVGNADLIVNSITSDDPAFTIVVSPSFPQNILPSGSLDATVRFSPTVENHTAAL